MLESIPYWCRVAVLFVAMSLVAGMDWHRHRQKAAKWKEYGFVVLAGIVGMVFGFFNDLITSSISSEYFLFGKGLAVGDALVLRAGVLGMKAGFSAGAIAGAICLYASTRHCSWPPLPYRRLLGFLWRPIALAALTAMVLAFCFRDHDPLDFSAQLDGIVDSRHMRPFLLIWWIHVGLYLGLLMSVGWILVDVARLRKRR